jgi:hypothetical protein
VRYVVIHSMAWKIAIGLDYDTLWWCEIDPQLGSFVYHCPGLRTSWYFAANLPRQNSGVVLLCTGLVLGPLSAEWQ